MRQSPLLIAAALLLVGCGAAVAQTVESDATATQAASSDAMMRPVSVPRSRGGPRQTLEDLDRRRPDSIEPQGTWFGSYGAGWERRGHRHARRHDHRTHRRVAVLHCHRCAWTM